MPPPDEPSPADALLAHREWVARTARGLVYGEADPDDVEQQAWLEVLERPPVRTPDAPRGWLHRVLKFRAIDAARTARTRRHHEQAAARPEQFDASPADLVAPAELLDRVAHAVLELDEPYRQALLLRYFEDLPAQQIAARSGEPVEAVRTRIKRGLAMLRARLDAEHRGDRRAWVLALLPVVEVDGGPPRPGTVAGPGAGVPGSGAVLEGILMGISAKTVAALVVVAVGGSIAWVASSSEPERPTEPHARQGSETTSRTALDRPARADRDRPTAGTDTPGGVKDVATPPIVGARLVVRVTAAPEGTPIDAATVVVSMPDEEVPDVAMTSDATGRAARDGFPAGPCSFVVRAPGRVRADLTATLETGRETVVDAKLAGGGAVTGLVLGARDGKPLSGARVVVVPGGAVTGPGGASSSMMKIGSDYGAVETDARGRFRIDGVERGEIVTVRAAARGHTPAAESFVLPAETKDARDVTLHLPVGGTLHGVVHLPDGRPAADAVVFVLPADAEDMLATPTVTRSSGGRTTRALASRAADDGAYEVDGLEPGGTFVAVAVANAVGRSSPARGLAPTEGAPSIRHDFTIRPAPSVKVRVLRPDGSPATGVNVMLVALGFLAPFPEEQPGVYVRAQAAPGHFPLHVTAEGWIVVETEIDIPETGEASMDVRLEKGLVLAGVLVDDTGKPMPGFTMVLGRPWQMSGKLPPSEGRTTTDAAGRFRVEGLRSGAHQVILVQTNGGDVEDDLRVEVPADDARVVVQRGGTVRARLVVPAGGVLPEKAGVAITQKSVGGTSTSRVGVKCEAGVVTIDVSTRVAARIVFEIAGWAPVAREVTVAPGAALDLGDIVLDPGVDLAGRVVDATGTPIADASVSAGELWSQTRQDATTGADGRFVLHHLARGAVEVSVAAEGFLDSDVEATVPTKEPLVVTLHRGGALVVRVLDAAGKPRGGVNVRMTRDGDPSTDAEAETTDHRGRIELRVRPGRWTVRLCDDEWREIADASASKVVDVTEGGGATADFVAPAAPAPPK